MSDIIHQIEEAITGAMEDADVRVQGGGGHFVIEVVSTAFEGKNTIQKHRMVLRTIKHLMKGDHAPVHAIDTLRAYTPDEI